MTRERYSSGVEWEERFGYSRAIRHRNRIFVAGTTATGPDGLVGGDDAGAQARYALQKIETALEALGGRLQDVVRTRVYVSRLEDWEAVASVHGEFFSEIRPVNTLVRADLVGPEYLVEIEADAVLDEEAPESD